MIEEEAKQVTIKEQVELSLIFLSILFDPEDGGSMIIRNFGKLLPDYATSHIR
jgi:hypothetical protein